MRPLERAKGAEPSQGHVSGRGLCCRSAAWPKGLGHKEEAVSNEEMPSRSNEPFGEPGLLQSSVPLSAAPPQNGLVFTGLLT